MEDASKTNHAPYCRTKKTFDEVIREENSTASERMDLDSKQSKVVKQLNKKRNM